MGAEVLCAVRDGVASVTLNRPEKRNALNTATVTALGAHLDALERDRQVRVLVVRGAGKVFCAGMDLDEFGERQREDADPERGVVEILGRLGSSRLVTLAVIHGDAIAGGFQLALHCDLRLAAERARFGMPLARLGLVVPPALGLKLVEMVGASYATELLLTGEAVTAVRAREMGLVHRVHPPERLEEEAAALAAALAGHAPLALSGMKAFLVRAAARGGDWSAFEALAARARQSADAREGVRAMLDKRRPTFRGE